MSAQVPIRELVKGGLLPTGRPEGLLLMLRAYFDDSGTHADSEIAVMGGLIGTVEQWERFERAWAAKLDNPLPGWGKSPLRMFHLSACAGRWPNSEFADYSDAEQDAVIHDFRQIIIDAHLTSIAMAVDKRAWDSLIVGPIRDVLGDALAPCFEKCLEELIRIANPHPQGDNIAVWVDQGIQNDFLRELANLWTRPLGWPRLASIDFAKVECVLPLQGADIVATENYWHALDYLKQGAAALPRPHLRHFLDNMLHEGLILDSEAIAAEVRRRGPDGRAPE